MKSLCRRAMVFLSLPLVLTCGSGNQQAAETNGTSAAEGPQGVWDAVSIEGGGVSSRERLQVVVAPKTLTIRVGEKVVAEANYTLDPKRTPAWIDFDFRGQRTPGIYKFRKDVLQLCLGQKARPATFSGSDSTILMVCTRQRPTAGERLYEDEATSSASPDNRGLISACIHYKDVMLIAVTSEGVAAIVFDEPVERVVKYRFRFLKKGSASEILGEGSVFERYVNGQYAGGKLTIRAGAIRIGWSAGGDDHGWVYYKPEATRLQIASAERFEDKDCNIGDQTIRYQKLDLKRFLNQP